MKKFAGVLSLLFVFLLTSCTGLLQNNDSGSIKIYLAGTNDARHILSIEEAEGLDNVKTEELDWISEITDFGIKVENLKSGNVVFEKKISVRELNRESGVEVQNLTPGEYKVTLEAYKDFYVQEDPQISDLRLFNDAFATGVAEAVVKPKKTASVPVTVTLNSMARFESLEFIPPAKMSYRYGELLDLTGIGCKIKLSNGNETVIRDTEFFKYFGVFYNGDYVFYDNYSGKWICKTGERVIPKINGNTGISFNFSELGGVFFTDGLLKKYVENQEEAVEKITELTDYISNITFKFEESFEPYIEFVSEKYSSDIEVRTENEIYLNPENAEKQFFIDVYYFFQNQNDENMECEISLFDEKGIPYSFESQTGLIVKGDSWADEFTDGNKGQVGKIFRFDYMANFFGSDKKAGNNKFFVSGKIEDKTKVIEFNEENPIVNIFVEDVSVARSWSELENLLKTAASGTEDAKIYVSGEIVAGDTIIMPNGFNHKITVSSLSQAPVTIKRNREDCLSANSSTVVGPMFKFTNNKALENYEYVFQNITFDGGLVEDDWDFVFQQGHLVNQLGKSDWNVQYPAVYITGSNELITFESCNFQNHLNVYEDWWGETHCGAAIGSSTNLKNGSYSNTILNLSNCHFYHNQVMGWDHSTSNDGYINCGSAVYFNFGGTLNINDSTFNQNATVRGNGGAIALTFSVLNFNSGSVTENYSYYADTAGLYLDRSDAAIGCKGEVIVSENLGNMYGGIYIYDGEVTLGKYLSVLKNKVENNTGAVGGVLISGDQSVVIEGGYYAGNSGKTFDIAPFGSNYPTVTVPSDAVIHTDMEFSDFQDLFGEIGEGSYEPYTVN